MQRAYQLRSGGFGGQAACSGGEQGTFHVHMLQQTGMTHAALLTRQRWSGRLWSRMMRDR